MLCPTCYGKGLVKRVGTPTPCAECGGCGVLHCCEGLVAQPGEGAEAEAQENVLTQQNEPFSYGKVSPSSITDFKSVPLARSDG